jgi:hypothetical protein
MAEPAGSKKRVLRIPLDYYKAWDALQLWKAALAGAALLLASSVAGWGILRPDIHYSPGRVSAAHAMWENQCEVCHLPYTPTGDGGARLTGLDPRAADRQCQTCHLGPTHASNQHPEEVAHCGACHQEHRGRDALLAQVRDERCLNCHADLASHRLDVAQATRPATIDSGFHNVTSLSDHPAFRDAARDPGKLKFSHRRHLTQGLSMGPNDQTKQVKARDLPKASRDRYSPGANDDDLVLLNCDSCHRLEPADFGVERLASLPAAALPPRSSGAYFQPIIYENQCVACHPLNFEPGVDAYRPDPAKLVTHRLSPQQIDDFLSNHYARAVLENRPSFRAPSSANSLVGAAPFFTPSEREALEVNVRSADNLLSGRCKVCHDLADAPGLAGTVSKTPVAAPGVPTIWLKYARFDHMAHRAVACRTCHDKKYLWEPVPWQVKSPAAWADNSDVLIPQLNVCLQCHRSTDSKPVADMARAGCVECHNYHGGDNPLAGLGSKLRAAGTRSLPAGSSAAPP